MKVGIVGYQGFVGSALYGEFGKGGNTVVGIGRDNYKPLAGHHFDILVNADGNSSKPLAEKDPKKDFQMNVGATLDMLHDFQCDGYVHISSIEVYADTGSDRATLEDAKIEPERLSNYGFGKYLGELVARKHAKRWLILRLGGMVGRNMKKGPAYDILERGMLYVSEKSRYQYMNTEAVARIARELVQKGRWGEIYNVVGKGNIELGEFAKLAGVKLVKSGAQALKFDVSCGKLAGEMPVPATLETVKELIRGRIGAGGSR